MTRLLPALIAVLLTLISWIRFIGNGPFWRFYIFQDFQNCRKNAWTNIFFLNNLINHEEMCLQNTWYLAVDTHLFAMVLVLLWIFSKYPKLRWPILSGLLISLMCIAFLQNYTWDFDAVLFLNPELAYRMNIVRRNPQFHIQQTGFFSNAPSSILGTAMGYLFYTKQDLILIRKYEKKNSKYFNGLMYVAPILITVVPGYFSLQSGFEHSAFWSSIVTATGRFIFSLGMCSGLILCSRGFGGLTKRLLEWTPTVLLGRLSYTAYLVHVLVLLVRAGSSRHPAYLSEYHIIVNLIGDLVFSYIAALFLTLLFELPASTFIKFLLNGNNNYGIPNVNRNQMQINNKLN